MLNSRLQVTGVISDTGANEKKTWWWRERCWHTEIVHFFHEWIVLTILATFPHLRRDCTAKEWGTLSMGMEFTRMTRSFSLKREKMPYWNFMILPFHTFNFAVRTLCKPSAYTHTYVYIHYVHTYYTYTLHTQYIYTHTHINQQIDSNRDFFLFIIIIFIFKQQTRFHQLNHPAGCFWNTCKGVYPGGLLPAVVTPVDLQDRDPVSEAELSDRRVIHYCR